MKLLLKCNLETRKRLTDTVEKYMGKSEELKQRGNLMAGGTVITVTITVTDTTWTEALYKEVAESILFECGNVRNWPEHEKTKNNKLTLPAMEYGRKMCVPEATQMFAWGKGLNECVLKGMKLGSYGEDQLKVIKNYLPDDETGFIKKFLGTTHGVSKTKVSGGVSSASAIAIGVGGVKIEKESHKQTAKIEAPPGLKSDELYAYQLLSHDCRNKDTFKKYMETLSPATDYTSLWKYIFSEGLWTSGYERVWLYCMTINTIVKAKWTLPKGYLFSNDMRKIIDNYRAKEGSVAGADDSAYGKLRAAVKENKKITGGMEQQISKMIEKQDVAVG